MKPVPLGFEVGTGKPVGIPMHHVVVTGLTQLSGKTTTLEALIFRSGLRAIAFRTKRGESGFEEARSHPPFFRERADWRYNEALLEATMREKMRFERSWIIRVSKGARSLRDVYRNVIRELETAKGLSESVYTNLKAYLEIVLPEIERGHFTNELQLGDGVTVMDLVGMSSEMQSLVIASTLDAVYASERDLIVVIPEAWKFAPEGRGNPVKREAEKLIREGATIRLYLWLDSQDIAGVEKSLLKQVDNWILGRQREINEVEHTLAQVPIPRKQRPKSEEVMQLPLGHFFACFGAEVRKVYVRPKWLSEEDAVKVALGAKPIPRVDMDAQERRRYEDKIKELEIAWERTDDRRATLEREVQSLRAQLKEHGRESGGEKGSPSLPPAAANPALQLGPINLEAVERAVTISHSEDVREFVTTNPKGRIVYALMKDLDNKASSEAEIGDAMRERGWNYGHGTLAPELSKLVGGGDLIKEGARPTRYRLPGKIKIEVT